MNCTLPLTSHVKSLLQAAEQLAQAHDAWHTTMEVSSDASLGIAASEHGRDIASLKLADFLDDALTWLDAEVLRPCNKLLGCSEFLASTLTTFLDLL